MTTRERSAQHWFASHELRTPLQAIKGGVELLLEERATGLSALQVEALGLIAGATAELERCVGLLAELAAVEAEAACPVERRPLAGWLGLPEIGCHLARTPRLAAAAELEVLVAPGPATRAFGHLAALAGAGERGAPLVCDLATVEPDACSLSLSIGKSASGSGAVAWQLATALFERAGITLQQTAASTTLLTLRRAGRATISI